MKERIGIIDSRKSQKRIISVKLLSTLINNDYSVIIIKTSRSVTDFILGNDILLAKCQGAKLFAISENYQLENGVNLLLKMTNWHKTHFYILIGKKLLISRAKELCNSPNFDIKQVDYLLEDYIVGAIDPLDDTLEIYGDNRLSEILKMAFKEIMEEP